MKKMLMLALLLAGLLVAACDDKYPMASPAQDAAGKTFARPSSDRAALYVYRSKTAGSPLEVTLSQKALGTLGPAKWVRVEVKPGSYDLRCIAPVLRDGPSSLILDLAPGSVTFVNAYYVLYGNPSCRTQLVAPEAAKPTIIGGSRLLEIGGANDP